MEFFDIEPEMVTKLHSMNVPQLQSMSDAYKDAKTDKELEVHIYIYFLIFQALFSAEHLLLAVQRAQEWTSMATIGHPEHTRRSHILESLSTAVARQTNAQATNRGLLPSHSPVTPTSSQRLMPNDTGVNAHHFAAKRDYETTGEGSGSVIESASLASWFSRKYRRTGVMGDLNRAIDAATEAVDAGIKSQTLLRDLGSNFGTRFQVAGSIDDLNRAIEYTKEAMEAAPQAHPEAQNDRINLASFLGMRFERAKSMNDLSLSIEIATTAANALDKDNPNRAVFLSNLGNSLGTRFKQTGSKVDLDNAVDFTTEAVDIMPLGYDHRVLCLSNAVNWLGERYKQTEAMGDSTRAIELAVRAVNETSQNSPGRATCLSNLANQLGYRFDSIGSLNDLDRAIDLITEAIKMMPPDHPKYADRCMNRASWHGTRFRRTGLVGDLNIAIGLSTEALDAMDPGHSNYAAYLNNVGNWLSDRFDRLGSFDDLQGAINFIDKSLETTPEGHAEYIGRLNNLGAILGNRYKHLGSIGDLDRAVDVAIKAVGMVPKQHPNRAICLNTLQDLLGIRFERTGSMDDLNNAVKIAESAVQAAPPGHPNLMGYLNSLGRRLIMRFERTAMMADLDGGIEATTEALKLSSQDHPRRAGFLNNLGIYMGMRFQRTRSVEDLDSAIKYSTEGLEALPGDHPDRAMYLSNLGTQMSVRFNHAGSKDDLNLAIEVHTEAVEASNPDHPDHASHLGNLGSALGRRFKATGVEDDLGRQISVYTEGWNCTAAPPHMRISLAKAAAHRLKSQQKWDEASQLLREAVLLLPMASPRSLKSTDTQGLLVGFPNLASEAAATVLSVGESPVEALRLLELGRGIIASTLMDMRGDISDLRLRHTELAERFESLREQLDSQGQSPTTVPSELDMASQESQWRRRREADKAFRETVEEIRTKPGFQNFLAPPSAEDLMAAANPNPIVVINTSDHRCDAFLVEKDEIRVLELPHLTLDEVEKRASELKVTSKLESLLEWLWDSVCASCLNALGFTDPVCDDNWPHVWWIPTGLLSQFPLHAAGHHHTGGSEAVIESVISSYATSIKALIHGRRQPVKEITIAPEIGSAVLVGMEKTPNLSKGKDLPFAGSEIAMLKHLCPSLELDPVTPPRCRDGILKALQGCKVFHFAGHGKLDRKEPSRSFLLLEDWEKDPLTVDDIRQSRLQDSPPFLAYLSACSTGASKVANLSDEGIHLISAFQLAGFRHVIGTLWDVQDEHCVHVARLFYESLRGEEMPDVAVSRGLHQTLRHLRNGGTGGISDTRNTSSVEILTENQGMTSSWIPYIHFGV